MTLSTPSLTLPDLDAFLVACAARGLSAAVVRSVDEPRARTHGHGVTVGHVREVTVLAYDRGEVRLRTVVDRTY